MDQQAWALIGAVVGIVFFIQGVLWSRRAAREARRAQFESEHALSELIQALQRKELDPETQRKIARVIEAGPIHFGASGTFGVNGDVIKAGSSRTGSQQRTVEVESQDGSRATLGVDPTDAASVRRFLDDTRRLNAERVLAVR